MGSGDCSRKSDSDSAWDRDHKANERIRALEGRLEAFEDEYADGREDLKTRTRDLERRLGNFDGRDDGLSAIATENCTKSRRGDKGLEKNIAFRPSSISILRRINGRKPKTRARRRVLSWALACWCLPLMYLC